MARCIDCNHHDLRSHPAFARSGMGKCKVQSIGAATFVTSHYARQCDRFDQAAPDVIVKREQFIDNDNRRRK